MQGQSHKKRLNERPVLVHKLQDFGLGRGLC